MNHRPRLSVALFSLLASLATAAAQGPGPRLTVRVVGAGGAPVAGAEVLYTLSVRGRGSPEMLLASFQFPLGDVVCRAATGADGTCHLDLPPARAYAFAPPQGALFVRAAGHPLRVVPLRRDAMPPGPELVVAPGARAVSAPIRVSAPDGAPAAGVVVRAIGVDCGKEIALLPDVCAVEARTDDRGVVRFDAVPGVATVEVRHPTLGTQVGTRSWSRGLDAVHLKVAAPLELVVEAAGGLQPAAVAGQRLRMWTVPAQRGGQPAPEAEQLVMGYHEAAFDAEGRLRCTALAPGRLLAEPVGAVGDVAAALPWTLVHAPEGGSLKVAPARVRTVRGQVVDAATRRGVPGAEVQVYSGSARWRQVTGDDGGFAARVFGQVRVALWSCPPEFRSPETSFGEVLKPGVTDIGPFEVRRGETLGGRVVAEGRGVAGAFVVAEWKETSRFGQRERRRWAFSGADGRFSIAGVAPDVVPTLTARADGGRSVEAPAARGGDTVLALDVASSIPIAGTIRRGGQGVAGARVAVERQEVPAGRAVGGAQQEATGLTVTTDAAGRYACRVPAGPEYRIVVEAPGCAAAGSAWTRSSDAITLDLRVRPLVTCTGKVVRDGAPVAGATVTCPARGVTARTGADGAFALAGVPEGPVLVVIDAGGMHARLVPSGAVVDLARKPTRRAAPALPLEQRLTLARKVLGISVKETQAAGTFGKDLRLWQALAVVDPAGTFVRLETEGLDVAWYGDAVRRELIRLVDVVDPAEALAMCETLDGEDRRALNLANLGKQRPPAEARGILCEALLSARRIAAPDMRLCVLSRIGEGFLDAGDTATALRVFEEAEPLVAQLPDKEWPGYARACFATETAVIDLPRALKIVEGMNKQEQDRHFANIAHELAAKNPEAAEGLLGRLSGWARDHAVARVCQRMVTADPARARRLADGLKEPAQRAVALAAMAVPQRSAELIDAALRCHAGAGILRYVAAVAPERLDEALGRVIAGRMPRSTEPRAAWSSALQDDCEIAAQVAPHDLDLARAVMAEAIAARGYLLSDRRKYQATEFFTALALVEPHLAAQVVEEIAADHPQESYRMRPQARQTVAQTLARRGPADLYLEEDQ